MYTEQERAKWRQLVARWKAGEKVFDAGKRVEKTDATTVQRQEPVLPIKRNFIAEAQRKHSAEAVGPDTRSSYQRKQSQAAKQYANRQYLKAKDDAKRAEGMELLMKTISPSTYVEAATGLDLGTAGRLITDAAAFGFSGAAKSIAGATTQYGRKFLLSQMMRPLNKNMPSVAARFRNQEWSNFLSTTNGDNYYRIARNARMLNPDEKYFFSHTTPWEEFSGGGSEFPSGAKQLYEFPTETFGKLNATTHTGLETPESVVDMGTKHLLYGNTSSGSRGPVRVLSDKNAELLEMDPFINGTLERPRLPNGFYDKNPNYENIYLGNQTTIDGNTVNQALQNATHTVYYPTQGGVQKELYLTPRKTSTPTYIEAATGKDLGDAGRLVADLAIGGVTAIPKRISNKVIKDAAYKAAVESGNKQEAYRLLEEAYLNSGVQKTPITIASDGSAVGWYHGSEWGNHAIFDSSAMNATIGGTSAAGKIKGNFLTTDVPSAMRYAGHGRYTLPNVPEYTSPQNFVEKLQSFFGMYKPRKLYPAERVRDYAPRPERLFDTEGKPPIDHLDKTDNVVYPMYVNPGENPMILDFKGNPWSQSPVEFPNNFYLKRWVRDDAAKTYRNEIVPFKNKEEAMAAWKADPINVLRGQNDLEGLYFDDGIRYIEGFNSAPRYETVKLVEERVPNTTNGAIQTAAREGNSSVLIKNVIDSNGGPEGVHYAIDDFITLKPEQMKLADITYDDAGNLIPLSQRFNWNLKDIRYGITPLLAGWAGYGLYNKYAE